MDKIDEYQKSTPFFLFNVHHVNLNLFGYSVNPQSMHQF